MKRYLFPLFIFIIAIACVFSIYCENQVREQVLNAVFSEKGFISSAELATWEVRRNFTDYETLNASVSYEKKENYIYVRFHFKQYALDNIVYTFFIADQVVFLSKVDGLENFEKIKKCVLSNE